jgi:hypothetical protein
MGLTPFFRQCDNVIRRSGDRAQQGSAQRLGDIIVVQICDSLCHWRAAPRFKTRLPASPEPGPAHIPAEQGDEIVASFDYLVGAGERSSIAP